MFNFPEYFEYCLNLTPRSLQAKKQTLTLVPTDYKNDKEKYAREIILWGRKSGNFLTKSSWS